ncbi:winged helix-turn-helix domain-containing protein [Streptacidiphilus melanogenes]|uniref:winged helix-turn-helix domain-containing protein n=1 Tax=Streptacidiphilus melanogenes TaxID=411235 RepID=UPI0005A963DF|nr:helix-turn-helix domain-containing protein [Streptacidiphilus melanogenes]
MDDVRDVRIVEDVETLKALSDPLRLSILQAMSGAPGDRSWTAKELARELKEPQTKLYRHLKHLEEAGLILVAETRVVSGIVEQRYTAAQRRIQLSRGFLASTAAGASDERDAALELVNSALTSFERELAGALRSGRVRLDDADERRRPMVMIADFRLAADRAEAYRARLRQLMDELNAEPDDPDGVPVHVMLAMYRPDE